MSGIWDSEKIFFDGDSYFESVFKDIDEARNYITLEMYIFSDDPLGKKLSEHLIKAQERGVKVQMVVDGIGSYGFFDKLHAEFLKKGILVKIYNPLPLYHPYYGKLTFIKKMYVFGARVWRLNRRDHRKIITIDNNIMYTGSFNVTVEHTRLHSMKAWKDMGIRVTGEQVKFAVLNFKKIWKLRDYYRFKKQNKDILNFNWRVFPLRLNQTLYMKRYFSKNFLQRIQQAERQILLMTPYFIPKRRLIRLLGKAAQRGVDVRILISRHTDIHFFKWLQFFYYSYLIKKGVKVYQYTDSVLHAKNYIIDDFITIGSTNLNHRSFIHDLEVDLAVQDEDNKKKVVEHFLTLTESQHNITTKELEDRPFLDRLLSRLFFLFKYWF